MLVSCPAWQYENTTTVPPAGDAKIFRPPGDRDSATVVVRPTSQEAPMSNPPPIDRQAGVAIGDFASDSDNTVAHGDRRDEVHYEADGDPITRVSHLVKPDVLPPDEVSRDPAQPGSHVVQDVGVVPRGPSVWDASPSETTEDADR
jgi:hypothetical protein